MISQPGAQPAEVSEAQGVRDDVLRAALRGRGQPQEDLRARWSKLIPKPKPETRKSKIVGVVLQNLAPESLFRGQPQEDLRARWSNLKPETPHPATYTLDPEP